MIFQQNSRTVLVTYIYPSALPFFGKFIESIANQTTKDFDIIIFSDKVDKINIPKKNIEFQIIPLDGTPLEIRFKSLDLLKRTGYHKFVFVDSDDTISLNRLETVINELDNNAFVCNDLNLMDESGKIFAENIWHKRLTEHFTFDSSFILDKNILGFGNTALRKEMIDQKINEHKSPIAADWFIFYQLLKETGEKAIFITDSQTNYRQHQNNIAGISKISLKRIEHVIKVKKLHYNALLQFGFSEVKSQLDKVNQINLEKSTLDICNDKDFNPFWWEETTFF